MDGKPVRDKRQSPTPGRRDSKNPELTHATATASEGRVGERRRSRPSPGAGLVKSLEACDELGSIAIRASTNAPAPSPARGLVNDVGVDAPVLPPAIEQAVAEPVVQTPARFESPSQDKGRVRSKGPLTQPPATEHNAWPQWLLAVAVFGGVIWYLLSSEASAQQSTRGALGIGIAAHEQVLRDERLHWHTVAAMGLGRVA